MSIISKTKLAILKELSKQPLHGYALAKKLNITISSIYAHLSELEQYGFVTHTISKRRKIYSLTKKGKIPFRPVLKLTLLLSFSNRPPIRT